VDSSCTRSWVHKLHRAASALVILGELGHVLSIVASLVWTLVPQASPASEYVAAAQPFQLTAGVLEVRTDCKAVYLVDRSVPASPSGKVPCAAIVRDRLAYPRRAAVVRPLVWMRTRQDVGTATEGEEGLIRGNVAVDEAIKAATKRLHPSIDEGGAQNADTLAKKAWLILRAIGAQAAQLERPDRWPQAARGGEAERLARGVSA
jgi:hypothetical protein